MIFATALCLLDHGSYVDALEQMEEVRRAAPGSAIVRLTFDRLQDRLADEAKDRLRNEANRRIGRLLGRRAKEPERPPRPEGC